MSALIAKVQTSGGLSLEAQRTSLLGRINTQTISPANASGLFLSFDESTNTLSVENGAKRYVDLYIVSPDSGLIFTISSVSVLEMGIQSYLSDMGFETNSIGRTKKSAVIDEFSSSSDVVIKAYGPGFYDFTNVWNNLTQSDKNRLISPVVQTGVYDIAVPIISGIIGVDLRICGEQSLITLTQDIMDNYTGAFLYTLETGSNKDFAVVVIGSVYDRLLANGSTIFKGILNECGFNFFDITISILKAISGATAIVSGGEVVGTAATISLAKAVETFTLSPPQVTISTLPDTGQTTCYDTSGTVISCTGTGQDGEYSINPMSFTDNGGGTVTDNVTGLMWQQEDDNQTYNWYEASGTYDAIYNPGSTDVCGSLSLAGYSDWRLPSKKELMSIVNYGTYQPAIDTTYFPNITSLYWSSTTKGTPFAWLVYFNSGYAYYYNNITNYLYVRCVRDGQYPTQSFTDNGNGTVTDNNTGLMWQAKDDNTTRTWEQALAYCEGFSFAGYSDWRLPNVKELESITDDTTYNPAIDTTYFPNTDASFYWSSTTVANYTSRSWLVYFSDGHVDSGADKTSSSYYVRCVR